MSLTVAPGDMSHYHNEHNRCTSMSINPTYNKPLVLQFSLQRQNYVTIRC